MSPGRLPPPPGGVLGTAAGHVALAVFLALFFASIPSGSLLTFVLAQYALFIGLAATPCIALYDGVEETEFMMMRGLSRATLARQYLQKLLYSSVAHAAGLFGAWALSGRISFPSLGLEGPGLGIKVFLSLLALQITFRSIWLLLLNAPTCTDLPAWARRMGPPDGWKGWWSLRALPVAVVLIGIPIAMSWALGTAPGLLVSAAIYPVLLHALVGSMEFATIGPSPRREAGPAPSSRAATPPGIVRFSPGRGLWWNGLATWVKVIPLIVLPLTVIGYFIALATGPRARLAGGSPELAFLVVAVSTCLLLLLMFGGAAFRWSSCGPSGEWLYMAGVRTAAARRIKLLSSAMLVLVSAGFGVGAFLVLARPDTWAREGGDFVRSPICFLLLGAAGHLLMWCNESPILRFRGRVFRGVPLRDQLRGIALLTIAAMALCELIGDLKFRHVAFPWYGLFGIALLSASVGLWAVGWIRTSDVSEDREDSFRT